MTDQPGTPEARTPESALDRPVSQRELMPSLPIAISALESAIEESDIWVGKAERNEHGIFPPDVLVVFRAEGAALRWLVKHLEGLLTSASVVDAQAERIRELEREVRRQQSAFTAAHEHTSRAWYHAMCNDSPTTMAHLRLLFRLIEAEMPVLEQAE